MLNGHILRAFTYQSFVTSSLSLTMVRTYTITSRKLHWQSSDKIKIRKMANLSLHPTVVLGFNSNLTIVTSTKSLGVRDLFPFEHFEEAIEKLSMLFWAY